MARVKDTHIGKKGGLLVGDSHADGGIKVIVTDTGQEVEVEGGEVIINKHAVKKHWKTLSEINQSAGNGVPILPPSDFSDKIEYGKGGTFSIPDLKRGTEIEMEHASTIEEFKKTGVPVKTIAKRIAEDHLKENANYYKIIDALKLAKGGEVVCRTCSHTWKPNFKKDKEEIICKSCNSDNKKYYKLEIEPRYKGSTATPRVTNAEKPKIVEKWKSLVNMTNDEIIAFYDTYTGLTSSVTNDQAKEYGIERGRTSSRWIVEMNNTTPDKWNAKQWQWAKKIVNAIPKILEMDKPLRSKKGKKEEKLKILYIWGHDPEKFENGGGVGGTSDSAEDLSAPTIGGTMESSMAKGGVVKYITDNAIQVAGRYKVESDTVDEIEIVGFENIDDNSVSLYQPLYDDSEKNHKINTLNVKKESLRKMSDGKTISAKTSTGLNVKITKLGGRYFKSDGTKYDKGGNISNGKEMADALRKLVKEKFPTYKFSITSDYNSFYCALMEADFNPFTDQTDESDVKRGYLDVNQYSFQKSDDLSDKAKAVFKVIHDFVSPHVSNRNAGDPYADYVDYNIYIHYKIGKWDKPFVQTEKKDTKSDKKSSGKSFPKIPKDKNPKFKVGQKIKYKSSTGLKEGVVKSFKWVETNGEFMYFIETTGKTLNIWEKNIFDLDAPTPEKEKPTPQPSHIKNLASLKYIRFIGSDDSDIIKDFYDKNKKEWKKFYTWTEWQNALKSTEDLWQIFTYNEVEIVWENGKRLVYSMRFDNPKYDQHKVLFSDLVKNKYTDMLPESTVTARDREELAWTDTEITKPISKDKVFPSQYFELAEKLVGKSVYRIAIAPYDITSFNDIDYYGDDNEVFFYYKAIEVSTKKESYIAISKDNVEDLLSENPTQSFTWKIIEEEKKKFPTPKKSHVDLRMLYENMDNRVLAEKLNGMTLVLNKKLPIPSEKFKILEYRYANTPDTETFFIYIYEVTKNNNNTVAVAKKNVINILLNEVNVDDAFKQYIKQKNDKEFEREQLESLSDEVLAFKMIGKKVILNNEPSNFVFNINVIRKLNSYLDKISDYEYGFDMSLDSVIIDRNNVINILLEETTGSDKYILAEENKKPDPTPTPEPKDSDNKEAIELLEKEKDSYVTLYKMINEEEDGAIEVRKSINATETVLNEFRTDDYNIDDALESYFTLSTIPLNLSPSEEKDKLIEAFTETPAFKAWFGDYNDSDSLVSKVVDDSNKPLIVYHGTSNTFEFSRFQFGKFPIMYFARNRSYAEWFAKLGNGIIYECFLDIKFMVDFRPLGTQDYSWKDICMYLKKHYGIELKNPDEEDMRVKVWQWIRGNHNNLLSVILDAGYTGIAHVENNPNDLINGKENITEAFMTYYPEQSKLVKDVDNVKPFNQIMFMKKGGIIKPKNLLNKIKNLTV